MFEHASSVQGSGRVPLLSNNDLFHPNFHMPVHLRAQFDLISIMCQLNLKHNVFPATVKFDHGGNNRCVEYLPFLEQTKRQSYSGNLF
jgi:hypothetical protein